MDDLIESHDSVPDCDCRNCACRARDTLRDVLQRIAAHHEEQRAAWSDEEGDADQARYHEERRNFAMFHLTPNDPNSGAARGPIAGGPLE